MSCSSATAKRDRRRRRCRHGAIETDNGETVPTRPDGRSSVGRAEIADSLQHFSRVGSSMTMKQREKESERERRLLRRLRRLLPRQLLTMNSRIASSSTTAAANTASTVRRSRDISDGDGGGGGGGGEQRNAGRSSDWRPLEEAGD